ncbi:MAG: S-layer homology domain-containing protein [Chloroflexota bacterium]|nr:S-layer homology domain-containing protein [Chloroflexota bacterium]
MSRRFASSILILLLGLVLAGLFVFDPDSKALAGAPPNLERESSGSTAQRWNAPAQPAGSGGWDLMSGFPNVQVPFPSQKVIDPRPASIKRAGAAFYHPNGKIYLLGGRMGLDGMDNPISYNNHNGGNPGQYLPPYTWIFEYTPATGDNGPGTWTRKSADIDPCPSNVPPSSSVQCPGERYTSNMAVVTLTDTNGVAIYAVGGSNVSSMPTNRVLRYNVISDTVSYLTTDPWPANPARIPGGYAVLNNKLYIFGGFDPRGNGTTYADTWVFDPMSAAGSRWSQLPPTGNLSTPRTYIAGVALGGYVYAIGGDTWQTHVDIAQRRLVPSSVVERLNPMVGVWERMSDLPEGKGDLGAWSYESGTGYGISGNLVVAGGHSNPPDSSNYLVPNTLAYMFEPPSAGDLDGSWTSFIGLTYATRNFGYAARNGFLYAIGGYDYSTGRPESAGYTQRFDTSGPIPSTTPTPTPSNTSTPSNTATPSYTVTGTPPTSTPTSTVTNTPAPTSTACPVRFQDVATGSTFYPFVRCLACEGVLSGYPCGGPGEPCGGSGNPYFRPGSNITRGQIAKIVSESAGLTGAPQEQIYEDVAPDSPFYQWINRLSRRGYMGGYACGSPGEPCGEGNRPYFRPNDLTTRGQLSKIVANAALLNDAVSGQTYADVPVSNDPSSFYVYIERLTQRNVMGGYACGTADPNSGPCDDQDRPYFRPGNAVTRGQAAKIVANTFYPNCQTPARP